MGALTTPTGAELIAGLFPPVTGVETFLGPYKAADIDADIAARPTESIPPYYTTLLRTGLTDIGLDPDALSTQNTDAANPCQKR